MNESKLPKGFIDKEWEQNSWGYVDVSIEQKVETKKCDCGAWKTFGDSCEKEYHYDWCQLNEKN